MGLHEQKLPCMLPKRCDTIYGQIEREKRSIGPATRTGDIGSTIRAGEDLPTRTRYAMRVLMDGDC